MLIRQARKYIVLLLAMSLVLLPVIGAYGGSSGTIKEVLDNELVITGFDDSGAISQVQVLEHQRIFGEGSVTLESQANYGIDSVRNIYGNEPVSVSDGKISLKADLGQGKDFHDVYYLEKLKSDAASNIKYPVTVKIEYYLDGKKVEPGDLAGASGHLKIYVEVENVSKKTQTLEFPSPVKAGETVKQETVVYTPYVVSLSGWEFDSSRFKNVVAPGVSEQSPSGVVVDVKNVTTVSWSVPLIPPKYPAKQFCVLEADGKDIELPAFKIVAIPILPTSSEVNNIPKIQESLIKLYDGFSQIEKGMGNVGTQQTLIWGLDQVKQGMVKMNDGCIKLVDGMTQVNAGINKIDSGLATLVSKGGLLRAGLSNDAFDVATYNGETGTDASGNSPGLKQAIGIVKSGMDNKLSAAFMGQKLVIGAIQGKIGDPNSAGSDVPTLDTSLANDVNYLKQYVKGTDAEAAILPMILKLSALNTNCGVFINGGKLVTSEGETDFPASISAIESGVAKMSVGLGKASDGIDKIVAAVGDVDENGIPVAVLKDDGSPATLLYALYFMQSQGTAKLTDGSGKILDGLVQMKEGTASAIPGVVKLQDGATKIATGSADAQTKIEAGVNTMAAAPAILSALDVNAKDAHTFMGHVNGVSKETGSVAYVFQTAPVSKAGTSMSVGLLIALAALVLLFFIGRAPKQKEESAA